MAVEPSQGFGVARYPFGHDGLLDLKLAPRATVLDRPTVEITGDLDVDVELIWAGGSEIVQVRSSRK